MAQRLAPHRAAPELAASRDGHVAPASESSHEPGYEWVALSVTTVGALLAALRGSSLIIALPDVLTGLGASFLTIMWVLLGFLLITTALVPVVGRVADMLGRKRLYVSGFAVFTVGSLLAGLAQPQFHGWDLVGLHQAFLVSFGITAVAALASALRPSHSPRSWLRNTAETASAVTLPRSVTGP